MFRLPKILAIIALIVIILGVGKSIIVSFAQSSYAGINIDPTNPSSKPSATQLKAAGAAWVRFVQKGSTDYSNILNEYSSAGIKTILVINQETLWPASGNGNFDSSYVTSFGSLAKSLAQKYGSKVSAYEIWNEEDASSVASIYVPPENYALLLAEANRSIKSVSSASVLVGGLVSGNANYLDAIKLKLKSSLPADGVAIHPYSTSAVTFESVVNTYLGKTDNKPIWITEVGWETNENNGQTQANYLRDIYQLVASKFSSLPSVVWYTWSDGQNPGFGLVTQNGTAKPSLEAFIKYAAQISGDQTSISQRIAQIQTSNPSSSAITLLSTNSAGNGTGTTTNTTTVGSSKLGIFVHGDMNGPATKVAQAKPKVLKLMIEGNNISQLISAAKAFKTSNPGGITVLRYFDQPNGYLGSLDPVIAATTSFDEYSLILKNMGANLSLFDYFETPNESERINHWESEDDVRWQNRFWSDLVDKNRGLGIKTCAASLTPGFLKVEHVSLLQELFSKLRETGGVLCYHGYSDVPINNEADIASSLLPSENTLWFQSYYGNTDFNGVNVIISELGLAGGWKKYGNEETYINWLKAVDCKIAQDPRILAAAIYEIGSNATGGDSINNATISDWLSKYLQDPSSNGACPLITSGSGTGQGVSGEECSPDGEGTIKVIGPSCGPSDQNNPTSPSLHPDINIKLRGFNPDDASEQSLMDYRDKFTLDVDEKSPNINELFQNKTYHPIVNSYRVGNWEGTSWAQDPWLNATAFQSSPGETLVVPSSGYDIGCNFEVMVLFVDDNSIFIKYTREDNAVAGYGIHILGIKPNQKLKDLYLKMNSSTIKRRSLPGLKAGDILGTAINDAVLVAYRDTGAFLDPRSCIDVWPGCPKDGFPNTPTPTISRDRANQLFSYKTNDRTYNNRGGERAKQTPACDVLSLANYPNYPPLGALQACPPEFPTLAKIETKKTVVTPPKNDGDQFCGITAANNEPEMCTNPPGEDNPDKRSTFCEGNAAAGWCSKTSCQSVWDKGKACSQDHGKWMNGCGKFIDGFCKDPTGGISDEGDQTYLTRLARAKTSPNGCQSLNEDDRNTIAYCMFYRGDKPGGTSGNTVQTLVNNFALPACVPVESKTPQRCVANCGDPLTLNESIAFTQTKANCMTGQCKATIKISQDTPLFVPFVKKLNEYFLGTLDFGAVGEGVTTEDELEKIAEGVKNGDTESINSMFAKSGVAKKLLPKNIQDRLKCQFVTYVKEKYQLQLAKQPGANTRYIYELDGKLTVFKIMGVPINEIVLPPNLDPKTCNTIGASENATSGWNNTPSAKSWTYIPLFDNDESQAKIEFVSGGVFTNSLNPIQTSVPEVRRLNQVTNVIQRALIPEYVAKGETGIAPSQYGDIINDRKPEELNLTIGPAISPGKYLLACTKPTPDLKTIYDEYDKQANAKRFALEPTVPSYNLGVDCVQQSAITDPTSKDRVCTVGPDGQLNCFQQLDPKENVVRKDFTVTVQTRNVVPYLYDIFLQTIGGPSGVLRIFKPTAINQNGQGNSPESRDEFEKPFLPYPAESNKIQFELEASQGVEINKSTNREGWKMFFDKLGGLSTAKEFILNIFPKTSSEPVNK